MTVYTSADAADQLKTTAITIRRHCRDHNIGEKLGSQYILTAADIKKLRAVVQPEPGRPRTRD